MTMGMYETAKIDPIIRQIVNRCHVSMSNMKVIRYVISRLRHKYATWKATPWTERRTALRMILAAHRENREEYRNVMGSGNRMAQRRRNDGSAR